MHNLVIDLSHLQPEIRDAIADIATRRGPGRPLGLDDVRDIAAAVDRLQSAYGHGQDSDAGTPDAHLPMSVGVPGAVLHRPTYGTRIRLIQADAWPIPAGWSGREREWATLVAAFCCAHAYDRDAIAAIALPHQAQAVIEAWGATLQATCNDLAAALQQLGEDAYPASDTNGDEKKNGTAPKQSLPSYAQLCRRPAAPPTTGSGKSRKPTFAGSPAKSPAATASRPPRPAAAARRSARQTPESRPKNNGASCVRG